MIAARIELWTEAGGALAAAALLPFYMGYLHMNLLQLFLYAAVAAAMLTVGEHLRSASTDTAGTSELFADFVLWAQMVLGLGLICYLLALATV